MPDDTDAGSAQGAQPSEPQGGQPPAQGAGAAAAQGASSADGGEDREALLARIAALEKDNRDYREERRKAAKKDGGSDPDQATRMAELEREIADMKAQRQEQSLRLASMTAAQKLGYRNPDLAYRMLDTAAVDYADDGTPRNVERLLTDLAKAEPYLLAGTDFGGGPRGSAPGGKADMNTLIRQAAGRQ